MGGWGSAHGARWWARDRFWLLGVALLAVLTMGAACTGTTSPAATGGTTDPGTHAKASQRDPSRTVRQLQRQGLTVRERARSFDTDCVAASYGDVRTWFRTHACVGVFRVLLEVTDSHGGDGLVAVAWVDMPTSASAADLKDQLDRYGTGNLTELTRAVRFTGSNYASVRDGATVVNAQAEPTGGTAWTIAPDTVAEDAVS